MLFRSELALIGTPGVRPMGCFYDITTQRVGGWSVHKWNLFQNTFLKDPMGFLSELIQKKGWTKSNPTYRREWCGEWVLDLSCLIYKMDRTRNIYEKLPDGQEWSRVIGIDLGFDDNNMPDMTGWVTVYFLAPAPATIPDALK